MAGTKISDLPSASTLTGAELVPVVQSDVTKKTTVADILASPGIGTVTSVNVSGGTTGLTATGGPITTTGTITLGGTLDVDNGGTGATTAANARTNLDVPSRSGSGASGTWSIDVTGNAGTVTNGVYTSGSYANPSWITSLAGSKITGNISGNAANVTGTVAIANGGTGATTASGARTALSVPSTTGSGASGTWSIDVTGNAGTVTNGVYTTGSYSNPSWITSLAGSKITGNISGNAAGLTSTLSTGTGGTGQTTYTNGQLLIGNASGSLSKATLTAGSNITITNGDGTITIAATGGGGGSGTVTSVDASGGTTGMTFSGGPITSSGTLTMAGTLAVANGGTNATTAANARINLLPSYTGNGGKVLAVNAGATDTEWIAAGGTGTVTSVAVSGGSTGLTTSGGPITGAGTITIAGTLGTANGGTNSTAAPTAGAIAYGTGTAIAYTAAGTAGQYLQSNGSSTPTWSSISSGVGSTAYYGAFQDTTDQTIASTTTAYVVAIGTTDEANGVSITSGSRITYANAGTYSLNYSIQLENANTAVQDVDIWVRKNGSDLADTNSQFSVANKHGGTNGHLIAVCPYVFTLAAGDYLEICWAATSTDVSIQTYPAQTSPTRPLTPGVIVTTAQLTQIGIGYYGLTSSSSVAIGTGTKTFTTNLNSTNTAFTVGSRVRVAYPPDPTYFMEGNITAFSGTTLTIYSDVYGGSGTLANWSFTSVGSAGVTSISGGTTGLTPSTATTGAVTLAGTVATTNGGTGLTSFTSGGAVYATSTSALTTGTLPVASGGTGATDAATARANLGAGTGNGTVTSVGGTGTVNGITLTGTVTSSGSLTLGGTLSGVSLTSQVSGTLPVANGGTGLTSGTSGGVLYYSATGTLASSSALAANALVIGGGAGVAPSTITTGTGVVTALGVNTGSAGAFVVNGGALGTPSSGTLTNATGLPVSTGISGLGANVATFLATPSSANLAAAVTDETGSGSLVFATSPTLTTPILGTPTSGNLSNCTADGTNAVGFKNIPQSGSDKVTSYTLATTDVGKFIGVGTSGSIVVPNSTFAAGDVVSIFNNTTGNVTITTNPTSSYIAGANTTKSSVTLATRGVATILFISGTVCVISGNVS